MTLRPFRSQLPLHADCVRKMCQKVQGRFKSPASEVLCFSNTAGLTLLCVVFFLTMLPSAVGDMQQLLVAVHTVVGCVMTESMLGE